MFSHTNACINYIKRRIRHVVFFNHGQQGTISFTINPRDSWMLNMKKVDIAFVVSEINEWLSKDAKDAKDIKNVKEAKEAKFSHWPKSIQWREASLLRSKVNHGDHFLVHYYETLTPIITNVDNFQISTFICKHDIIRILVFMCIIICRLLNRFFYFLHIFVHITFSNTENTFCTPTY